MRRAVPLFLALFLMCPMAPAAAELLELIGASTVANEIVNPLIEPFKNATGMEIRTTAVGTGKGMMALFEGRTKAAMVSESLEDALYTTRMVAKKEGVKLEVPQGLVMTPLGKNRLMLIVHRDNPVMMLTRTQIKDIFTGRITNWLELGGSDLPIRPLTSVLGNAIRTVVQRNIMDGVEYRANIEETKIPGDAIPLVGKYPGGVAIVSLSGWSKRFIGTRTVQTPDFSHPLGLITIGEPDAEVARLIGFIRSNSRI